MSAKVKVIHPDEAPVEKEVLAVAIVKASEAMQALAKSGLNRRAIVILVANKTHLHHYQVERVMDSLADLKKDYCTK